MSYERKKKFIVNIVFFTMAAAITVFILKYVVGWIMPFFIAFAVSAAINPLACKVSQQFKVKKKFAACFCAFLFYAVGVGLVVLIGFGIYLALKNWFADLPYIYAENIEPFIGSVPQIVQNFIAAVAPDMAETITASAQQFVANLGTAISDISVSAIGWLSSYITKVPFFVVGVLISVISTFFIASDYENIVAFIVRQLPESWHHILKDVKEYTVSTLGQYGKSYLLIMTITFCELSIGLWLLGVENFAIIALVTAVFDIIPVCGSGGVLIPWSVFSLVQGRFAFGIGMLILYAIISVIRQIIEPKIVGEQVGLPAIVTLMAMFLGVRFMGVLGIFVFPIALVIIKRLNDNGKIHLFK